MTIHEHVDGDVMIGRDEDGDIYLIIPGEEPLLVEYLIDAHWKLTDNIAESMFILAMNDFGEMIQVDRAGRIIEDVIYH